MESRSGQAPVAPERADLKASAPQHVYCDRFPTCHTRTVTHGREEQKPTKIATGHFAPGTWFRLKCPKCKQWLLVEFPARP
jgi:hypothetical protein